MANASHHDYRSKVLLLAYSCAPNRGSEPGVGWNWAIESAKLFDTWVISLEGESANEIRRYVEEQGEITGLHFTFVARCSLTSHFKRIRSFKYLFYNHWHRRAFRVAQQLHQQISFDLIHQVTFCGYREPGYLWKLEAPFVWGPIGGTQNYPWRFLCEAGLLGAVTEGIRNVLNYMQLRLSSRVRDSAHRAAIVLTANSTNQQDFVRIHRIKPVLMLETGIRSVAASPRDRDPRRHELRILWSGELSPWKGLPLLLKALALLDQEVLYKLRILGKGRLQRQWQRLAERMDVAPNISWMGWLPHPQALEQYGWADVFVFTSLRDTSGNAVLEALAAGVPVICLDHQGTRDIVTEKCGIKVPVTVPGEVVTRLSEAIVALAQDRSLWERLATGALLRAREYRWSRQGERMAAVYRRIIEARAGKADLSPALPSRDSNPVRNRLALRSLSRNGGKRAAGLIATGLTRVFAGRAGESFGILTYHRIAPRIPSLPEPSLNVTPERFGEQIAGLLRRGYVIRPLREVLRKQAMGLPVPPRTVVVTFDDGFASVYAHAWPLLKEFQATATIFLITAYLGGKGPFPFDHWGLTNRHQVPVECYRPLTIAECREMAEKGLVELGSHTHSHQDFRYKPAELARDTQTSLKFLYERFGLEEVSFAFPGGRRHLGQVSEELITAVKGLGVTCALTTECVPIDWRSDPFSWGRFNVYQWDSASTLAAKLEAWYNWAPRLQVRLRRLGAPLKKGGIT